MDWRSGQTILRHVDQMHRGEMQEPRFQHTQHLETRQRIGLKGHALGPDKLKQHGLQQRPGKDGAGHAVVLQLGDHPPDQPVQAFGIQGKAPPQFVRLQRQRGVFRFGRQPASQTAR